MTLAERRGQDIESSIDSLSLSDKPKLKPKATREAVADSWEDEEISSSGDDTETEGPSVRNDMPGPPPPTPVTPNYKEAEQHVEFIDPYAVKETVSRPARREADGRRPEKQTATANRMIAGALGVRAPKRTEEQRAYDKAIREKEQKKLDKEKEERRKQEQEKKKANDSIWGD